MSLTPTQVATRVAQKLRGEVKQYTHVITMKTGNKVKLESDEMFTITFHDIARECLLTVGSYPSEFTCRMADVDFTQSEKNSKD